MALIGRDAELADLGRMVAANRAVSLTGAPGIGKSALAAAIPRAAVRCSLSGAATADAVSSAFARALDATAVPRALASRGKAIYVLDEADLATNALAELLAEWLAAAPGARFLVVARTRVPGAQRFDLGPLEVPAADERDPDVLGRSASIRLFVRGARAAQPLYRVTLEAAPYLSAIVRAVAGNPLAIELCASRVAILGERELAQLLAERLDALDDSSGRTLRGAFALSWDQLSVVDQATLSACAAFRGSFELDAASAVTGQSRVQAGESLLRLEEASLVQAFEPDVLPGSRRYVLRGSVRVFLDANEDAQARHEAYFASLGLRSLDVLSLDRENLDAALGRAALAARFEVAGRVALVLAPLVLVRGPLAPFLAEIDPVLERAPIAALHFVRGMARINHGRRDEALADFAAAKKLARRAGDLSVEVRASSKIGLIRGFKGEVKAAHVEFARAAARAAEGNADALVRGVVSKDLANVLADEGRNAEAMSELSRARDFFHEAGDLREEGIVLMMLGSRLVDDGQVTDARRDCSAALALLESVGDARSTAWCHVLLALAEGEAGELALARRHLDAARVTVEAIGDAHTTGTVLGYLGNVALEQGVLAEAEAFLGDARLRLAAAGDIGAEAYFTAVAAIVDVTLGRAASARTLFTRARRLGKSDGRAPRREAIEALAAVLGPSKRKRRATTTAEELRFAARIVALTRARLVKKPESAHDDALVVAADGSSFRVSSGAPSKVRGALRRLLRRLAHDRVRYPGRPVSIGTLVRAGWPDEAILPAAAKNRLHVTIARLRAAGLGEVLIHIVDGYLLDPRVAVRLEEEEILLR